MEENDEGENDAVYNSLIISRLQTKMGGVIFICIYEKKAVPLQKIYGGSRKADEE